MKTSRVRTIYVDSLAFGVRELWMFSIDSKDSKVVSGAGEALVGLHGPDETHSGYSCIYNIFAGARTQLFVIAE